MKALTFLVAIVCVLPGHPQISPYVSANFSGEKYRQFDFWIGEWDVNLRIQQEDGLWKDQVQSTARIYSILDGKAILELWNENKVGEGIKGYSLRYFNEDSDSWTLWLNWPGKNRSGTRPMEGSFRHGRGEFFSEFPKNDSVIVTQRYTFSDITPTSLRWDNSFSEDGGKTWTQGTWIMEFSRKQELPPDLSHDELPLTYDSGGRCDLESFDYFDSWVGQWSGKAEYLDNNGRWKKSEAEFNVFPVLDGCAVLAFLTYKEGDREIRTFSLKTFNTYVNVYEEGILTNTPSSGFKMFYGPVNEDILTTMDKDNSGKNVWKKEGDEIVWEYHSQENGAWELKKKVRLKAK